MGFTSRFLRIPRPEVSRDQILSITGANLFRHFKVLSLCDELRDWCFINHTFASLE
jgi:precorrin-3B methylase